MWHGINIFYQPAGWNVQLLVLRHDIFVTNCFKVKCANLFENDFLLLFGIIVYSVHSIA